MSVVDIKAFAKFTPDNGRKLVPDNTDIHQDTQDHQNPDVCCCSLISTDNRVNGNHLANDRQICPIDELENGSFCPNYWEHKKQRQN